MKSRRPWVDDLLFGTLWFVGLYVFDAASSYYMIRGALKKVQHDPTATPVVAREVAISGMQMLVAYLLMGVLAGVLVGLLRKASGTANPRRVRLGFAVGVIVWMTLRGMVSWPLVYVGMPGLEALADYTTPAFHDAWLAVGLAAWLVWARLRHEGSLVWTAYFALSCVLVMHLDWQEPPKTPKHNKGPNVLIIGIDALRPDHLASFGYSREPAPHLDAYLGRSTVFESAFTPLARTWPAWASILTGNDPRTHGKRDSLPAPGHERPDVPMITDALVEHGIHTVFMTDDSRFSYMLPEHHFDDIEEPWVGIRAFALSREQPLFRAYYTFLNGPLGWAIVPVFRYNQALGLTHRPDYFANHVVDVLADASQYDQFFMVMHTCLLHSPGDRPWPYHTLFGMEDANGTNRFRYRSTGTEAADSSDIDADELEGLEADGKQQNLDIYDAGLAMVDMTWEHIEKALDDSGLWDNTLVIVLSDHGEAFYEGDPRYKFSGPNHGFHPWGVGQVRVLLSMHGGGFQPQVRTDLAGLVDVAPTVAKFLGVDFPSAGGVPLQDPTPPRTLYGETGASESAYWQPGHIRYSIKKANHRYTVDPATTRVYQKPELDEELIRAKDKWVLDDQFWLVREALEDGPRDSLYRWRDDPTMMNDVSEQFPEALATLREAMGRRP